MDKGQTIVFILGSIGLMVGLWSLWIPGAEAVILVVGNTTPSTSVINDTYVKSDAGGTNFGNATTIVARNIEAARQRIYLFVNFSALPASSTVTNATFYLTSTGVVQGGGGVMLVYNVTQQNIVGAFNEYTTTHDNQP